MAPPFSFRSTMPNPLRSYAALLSAALLFSACDSAPDSEVSPAADGTVELMSPSELPAPTLVTTLTGFEGPESVYYDADQDVWFVSSFTGDAGERDANGTVARVDGESFAVVDFTWAEATAEHPFHAGRGMTIQGDTLWVADLDGVHGFHRESGEQLVFVDLSALEPGFLNDVAASDDGTVWVTDTGGQSLIQVRPEAGVEVDIAARLGSPNGILWDSEAQGFWIAPWSNPDTVFIWHPLSDAFSVGGVATGASRIDGLVSWWAWIVAGAQSDSAIHLIGADGVHHKWFELPGRPADIGIDRGREYLAVPYVALNEVQIWALPRPLR